MWRRPSWRTEPGGEVIVAGELQQARMKADGRARAFQDGAAHIVVDQHPRTALKRCDGLDMAAETFLERLIEGEERKDRA